MRFIVLLEAFNNGYNRIGWATDWPCGLYRWAYVMGRRQYPNAAKRVASR